MTSHDASGTTPSSSPISGMVENLTLGEPRHFRHLTVVPVLGNGDAPLSVLTLDEALEAGVIEVTEISEGGSVPEVSVTSSADLPVLIIDGEELVGAKQNRVLNVSVLVAARASTKIPVSCVEAGRWRHTSRSFSSTKNMAFSEMRSEKMHRVADSMRRGGAPASDQHEVWEQVARMASSTGTSSPSAAMSHVYEHEATTLKECAAAFRALPGQLGHVVFVNGRIAGLDLFHDASLYARLHEKLIRSYSLSSRAEGDGSAAGEELQARARAFVEMASRAQASVFPGVSLGHDYRVESADVIGSALEHENHVLFAEFFAGEQSSA